MARAPGKGFRVIQFSVIGDPAPQGSKRVFNGVLVEASRKCKPWRERVHWAAKEACGEPIGGPVRVSLSFRLSPPKQWRPTLKLFRRRRGWPTTKPDIDKLARAVLDALTDVAYRDDSQVCALLVEKRYDNIPGLDCLVSPMLCAHAPCWTCGFQKKCPNSLPKRV
jgi:crossover junction endodeoxyribonuclease RusA